MRTANDTNYRRHITITWLTEPKNSGTNHWSGAWIHNIWLRFRSTAHRKGVRATRNRDKQKEHFSSRCLVSSVTQRNVSYLRYELCERYVMNARRSARNFPQLMRCLNVWTSEQFIIDFEKRQVKMLNHPGGFHFSNLFNITCSYCMAD